MKPRDGSQWGFMVLPIFFSKPPFFLGQYAYDCIPLSRLVGGQFQYLFFGQNVDETSPLYPFYLLHAACQRPDRLRRPY